jgi:hypothetical protein
MASSNIRKEQRKILKQMGIKKPNKTIKDLSRSIEEGKEKHRRHVQDMKNREIMEKVYLNPEAVESPNVFFYRGQEGPEYSNFQDLLMNRKWEETED